MESGILGVIISLTGMGIVLAILSVWSRLGLVVEAIQLCQ